MPEPAAIAVVPARGGSKRIPRKNVRDFRGRPLLVRTLEILRECDRLERIIVSTDDDDIADVAEGAGAQVPFRRPASLADDHTPTAPVLAHAITELEAAGEDVGDVCVVYPAAVFVTPTDIDTAGAQLVDDPALRFVATATTYGAPVQRALALDDHGRGAMVQPEHLLTRSQDLPERYHDAGQFYWGRRDAWHEGERVFEVPTGLHLLPRWRVQDIDTPEDWVRAELLHAQLEQLDDQ